MIDDFDDKAWNMVKLYDGVEELFAFLKCENVSIGIVTNGSSIAQNAKIDAAGLRDRVDALFIADELDSWKPEYKIFEIACNELKTQLNQTIFVGDSPICDVIPAHSLGMRTIWKRSHLLWPNDHTEVFDEKVDTVPQIASLLRKWMSEPTTNF